MLSPRLSNVSTDKKVSFDVPTGKESRQAVRQRWYSQLKDIFSRLDALPEHHLEDSQLAHLEIHKSVLDLEAVHDPDPGPLFFKPFPRESLEISSCAIDPPNHTTLGPYDGCGYYYWGCELSKVIWHHLTSVYTIYRDEWRPLDGHPRYRPVRCYEMTGNKNPWVVTKVFDISGAGKPHLIVRMVSECEGDERLVRSELIAMIGFMKEQMRSHSKMKHLVFPVLLISGLGPAQVRILEGHFDGSLHIRQSKLYSFNVPDHQSMMDLFVRWMMPTAEGDTTLSNHFPHLVDSAVHNTDERERKTVA